MESGRDLKGGGRERTKYRASLQTRGKTDIIIHRVALTLKYSFYEKIFNEFA